MRIASSISIVVLVLVSAAALGGATQSAPVTVTLNADGSGAAMGSLNSARFSTNRVELIGCGVRLVDSAGTTPFRWVFCQATTAASATAFCSTESPTLIEALKSLSDSSWIRFTWNAAGTCTSIYNSTQSVYIR